MSIESRAGRWSRKGFSAIAFGLTLLLTVGAARDATGFKVLVHGAQAGSAIRRAQLQDIFLKKVTQWGNGSPIEPVDQSMRSRARVSFSLNVLDLPMSAVQAYWERQVVSSRERPPVVLGSDEEVIAFVALTPGGIGYVSTEASVGDAVKVLKVVD